MTQNFLSTPLCTSGEAKETGWRVGLKRTELAVE